jgi:hypothetical protein
MANLNENLLVRGARGYAGKQFVYRKHGNNTNIVRMPIVNKDAVATEKQAEKCELLELRNRRLTKIGMQDFRQANLIPLLIVFE